MTPDKKLLVCVRSKEWNEWSEIEKACDDLMADWKASKDVQASTTTDGIKFYYDCGSATVLKRTPCSWPDTNCPITTS